MFPLLSILACNQHLSNTSWGDNEETGEKVPFFGWNGGTQIRTKIHTGEQKGGTS
jgi:hypothetical protein